MFLFVVCLCLCLSCFLGCEGVFDVLFVFVVFLWLWSACYSNSMYTYLCCYCWSMRSSFFVSSVFCVFLCLRFCGCLPFVCVGFMLLCVLVCVVVVVCVLLLFVFFCMFCVSLFVVVVLFALLLLMFFWFQHVGVLCYFCICGVWVVVSFRFCLF